MNHMRIEKFNFDRTYSYHMIKYFINSQENRSDTSTLLLLIPFLGKYNKKSRFILHIATNLIRISLHEMKINLSIM